MAGRKIDVELKSSHGEEFSLGGSHDNGVCTTVKDNLGKSDFSYEVQ